MALFSEAWWAALGNFWTALAALRVAIGDLWAALVALLAAPAAA